MTRQQPQYTVIHRYRLNSQRTLLTALLLLACFMLAGCQTVQPTNSTLKDMQEWTTPESLDRVLSPREQRQSKAAMVRWLEQYLKRYYQVVDQHYVLTTSGLKDDQAIESKVGQFAAQKLGALIHLDESYKDDNYKIFLWKLGDSEPRYIAIVVARDFLPNARDCCWVGYFELELQRVIVG
jgi:hypothetical protein